MSNFFYLVSFLTPLKFSFSRTASVGLLTLTIVRRKHVCRLTSQAIWRMLYEDLSHKFPERCDRISIVFSVEVRSRVSGN